MKRYSSQLYSFYAILILSVFSFQSLAQQNWKVRDSLSQPTGKQDDFGIGAIYVDIKQSNTILYVREINQNSLANANKDPEKLKFNGKEFRLDLSDRTEIVYVNLPEGLYQIVRVDVPHYDLPFKISTNNSDKWRFLIQQQSINYLGTIAVSAVRTKDSVDMLWLNQFAKNLEDLQTRVTASSIVWPINNGIGYKDPFYAELQQPIGG
ncbi:hypothetical protein [Glaciecola petra]|uniref:DUF2846 domain-containing protein n=1 Tax=Glaciecola petra TaxID=3075602 RepID=A0ABU2ZQ44_9ALTE|nr:hypothetical protein [Aestuariibacter sp. P117]MDT0594530.1 hypothetical protein [Aestuariibacter sp. P117]